MASLVIVVSAFLVLSCGQAHRHIHTHTQDANECLTLVTVVGMSYNLITLKV